MLIASSRLGMASSMSTNRIRMVSIPPPPAAEAGRGTGDAADQRADGQTDQRGDHADQQGLPGADDHPAELVAARWWSEPNQWSPLGARG